MTTPEQATTALETTLGTLVAAGTVVAVSRQFTLQQATKPPVLPIIYMEGDKEEIIIKVNAPPKRKLVTRLMAYTNVDADQIPGTTLNALLDAIKACLAPPPGQLTQTLGGIVAHCWIEGVIERFEVGKPGMAFAIIPINTVIP